MTYLTHKHWDINACEYLSNTFYMIKAGKMAWSGMQHELVILLKCQKNKKMHPNLSTGGFGNDLLYLSSIHLRYVEIWINIFNSTPYFMYFQQNCITQATCFCHSCFIQARHNRKIEYLQLPLRFLSRTLLILCATSRKVAGSIHDVVTGIFQLRPPGRTMALGSTQPITQMSKSNISLGGG